jgi:AcrR family transcriptional regulator
MSTLKERQNQLREDAILEATHILLAEQGYVAFNMDELANRVGISKATLYQHFPTKDELIIRVMLRGMKEGEATVRELSPSLSPLEMIEQVLRYSIHKRINIAISRFAVPPHLREDPRIKQHMQDLAEWLASLVEMGKTAGTIRRELSTPAVVGMFFSISFIPAYQDLLINKVVSPEELSETLVTTFLKGIASR